MVISHTFQSSCLFGIWIITCLQSSPSHLHSAEQVVRSPDWLDSCITHFRYRPVISHDGFTTCSNLTIKRRFEQTRRRPVITTEKAFLIASGTRFLMTNPDSQHATRGCGVQQRSLGENVYMSVCDREMHVSLFASFKRSLTANGAGGSKTGGGESRTEINIVISSGVQKRAPCIRLEQQFPRLLECPSF